jgi:DNA-directed RNA polymerase
MIVPPKLYGPCVNNKKVLGGFLLNNVELNNSLIIPNYELKLQSSILKDNIIYNMVNYLSNVSYKINTQVLNFILDYDKKFNLLIDMETKHPLELKDKLKKNEVKILESHKSLKRLQLIIINLALLFQNVPRFYFPVKLDNRGRIYCDVNYLNYQGIELAKSLLLFGEGKKIDKTDKNSINYLKIYGANCYGLDKKSFKDRQK